MDVFHLKMLVAARKKFLRDYSEKLTDEEINQLLDQLIQLEELIQLLEEEKGK